MNKQRGNAVLMLAHFAGMVDLVALPVWMGALVQHYGYDLEHAGMIITAFLLGAVGASLYAAPRYNRLPRRACAVAGYGIAALAFAAATTTQDFAILLPLHALAGLALGIGLSMVHGSIGRSANPHRLFAMAGTALGVGAVVFYAAVPPAIASGGAQRLFMALAGLMALTAIACIAFPEPTTTPSAERERAPLPRVAWLAVLGVTCMALNQSIIFSMLDRIGVMRGFGQDRVNLVLVVCGFVNLLPAALAALLQQRWSAVRVAMVAPLLQAALAVVIATSPMFQPYAVACSLYAAVLIFTHTFMFGLIARIDPSGRAVASTPAMMMTGSAIGPALAGSVAMRSGFGGLALLAVLVAAAATLAFFQVSRHARTEPAGAAMAAGHE